MTDTINTNGAPTGNPYVDSLINGGQWAQEPGKPAIINYYFQSGDDPNDRADYNELWSEEDKVDLRKAQDAWSAVANVKFVEAGQASDADVWYWKDWTLGTLHGNEGYHDFPGFDVKSPALYGVWNYHEQLWSESVRAPGGYLFSVFLHELGHGLGLAHPHDGGMAGDGALFPGVGPGNPRGDYDLNSDIYTVMSYNTDDTNLQPRYGFVKGPMAFDIAAMQQMYGANMSTATGNDVYMLDGENKPGIGYSCIWDAGGTDTISAGDTALACTINLNDAPLTGPTAGGVMSRADGILGGFTIANNAVIENAIGGSGNDTITGNEVANVLTGNGGDDDITAGAGDDTLNGGDGNDWLDTEEGDDTANGGAGNDEIGGRAGNDKLDGGNGNDWLSGDEGNDMLIGSGGNDELLGRDGNDTLDGGFGNDMLTGGEGKDRFMVSGSAIKFNIDTITDFNAADDTIAIDNLFMPKMKEGGLRANTFWIGAQAHDGNDRIIFDNATGKLWYDEDGKGHKMAQLIGMLDTAGITGTLNHADFVIV